jgi:Ras-related GTP-binding protein C/D
MDIIVTGVSQSGKTSLKKVIFEKKYPYETVFNDPTNKLENLHVESLGYCNLNFTEFPSTFYFNKSSIEYDTCLEKCKVLIFLIDTQVAPNSQYDYFKNGILPIFGKYKSISLYVFLHKIDNTNLCQNDYNKQRGEIQSKIKQMCTQFQNDSNLDDININFYVTSIYNSTLFEAFSKIFQNMMPQNRNLSTLIDHLTDSCGFEKTYLFDVFNKIYLAVDSSPNESQTYEMCTDIIDVVLDMSGIYGDQKENEETDSYFDDSSTCSIKINAFNNSKNILFLKFIHKNLALIAVINEENYERNNLLDYNINVFREAVKSILKFK